MRKIVIILIMCIVLIFTVKIVVQGVSIGSLEIWGVQAIIEENDTIDKKNAQLDTLVYTTYETAVGLVESNATTMQNTKEEYEAKAALLENSSSYLQTTEYEIEFLWTKIGNYAKENDVEIKIEVKATAVSGRYDLNFTVNGDYPDVTEFIYDIENDSEIGFKIENFYMIASEDGVKATFVCTDIKIDIESIDTETTTDTTEDAEDTTETEETEETSETTSTEETETTNTTDEEDSSTTETEE